MTQDEFDEAAAYWIRKDSIGRKMENDQLKIEADKFISANNVCALATGSGSFIRCTPIEYAYHDGALWMFSEGGLKFRGLKDNRNVSIAICNNRYEGFGKLNGMQIYGTAEIIEPFSEEYIRAAEYKKIPVEMLKKLQPAMHLIKVVPQEIDILNSGFKSEGCDVRQHLSAACDLPTDLVSD